MIENDNTSHIMETGTSQTARPSWHPLPEAFRIAASQTPHSVLLETAKPSDANDRSLLFLAPFAELVARNPEDLAALLDEADRYLAAGAYVAGYFHYECGEIFVGLKPSLPTGKPIAWLGVYASPVEFHHASGTTRGSIPSPAETPGAPPATLVSGGLEISLPDYRARIQRVQDYLAAGHSYQVNFTDRIHGHTPSSPLSLYQTLLHRQPVSFAAFVNAPGSTCLSFSPELFYRTAAGKITVRPMKGTWPRGLNLEQDLEAEQALLHDDKNRSEHVTIVDLLRNDIGRICTPGSVAVEQLFSVERYNTLLQMTSTITGTVQDSCSPTQIFRALFPSGSITGAPKRRTMEIIRELESHPRGIYTGSIGFFAPNGEACFNVAIRTLALEGDTFTLGVGGGITADSDADQEYEECRLKGAFLTRSRPPVALIETIRCASGIPLLDLHMRRLAASAAYFGIRYDAETLAEELAQSASQCGQVVSRIRVVLDETGTWTITASPLDTPSWNGRILLATSRTNSQDVFFHHKTTNRRFYDNHLREAKAAGFDEVLFQNEHGHLTECAISNLFLRKKGQWLTPALRGGVLPGVQRTVALQTLPAVEAEISLAGMHDVDQIQVGNSLRGMRAVASIANHDGEILWRDPSAQEKPCAPQGTQGR